MSAAPAQLPSSQRLGSRAAPRVRVDTMVELRWGRYRILAHMADFSQNGCRLTAQSDVPPESMVWICLPSREPVQARVAWSQGRMIGCAFVGGLEVTEFDRIAGAIAAEV